MVSACCTAVLAASSSSSATHVSMTNTYEGGDRAPMRGRLYSMVQYCGNSSAGTLASLMPGGDGAQGSGWGRVHGSWQCQCTKPGRQEGLVQQQAVEAAAPGVVSVLVHLRLCSGGNSS